MTTQTRSPLRPASLAVLTAVTLLAASPMLADGIDLVTLPERERVQVTVYNSDDLTLVRDVRRLTLRKGTNRLSFDWSGTLIDPTSLHLEAVDRPDAVELLDVSYPPGVRAKAVWTVESEIEGEVPVAISFFTSGLSWRAFYGVTLAADERTMRLDGYVRIENQSGENYENATTRVLVGKVNLIDRIAMLAQRQFPYGSPIPRPRVTTATRFALEAPEKEESDAFGGELRDLKEIAKEALSEYVLYTIEGTETLEHGWAKRLPSFSAAEVPVVHLYRFEEERFGRAVVRFLRFANDEASGLGESPIPAGNASIYRTVDDGGRLGYVGAAALKYIPVGQRAELEIGPAADVLVEPILANLEMENFAFDRRGNVAGFEEIQTYRLEVSNRKQIPVRVEIRRNLRHQYHRATALAGSEGAMATEDLDTLKFELDLAPGETRELRYRVRYLEGARRRAD